MRRLPEDKIDFIYKYLKKREEIIEKRKEEFKLIKKIIFRVVEIISIIIGLWLFYTMIISTKFIENADIRLSTLIIIGTLIAFYFINLRIRYKEGEKNTYTEV